MSDVKDPKLWKKIVAKVKRGSKYGKANSWNARKAQYAVKLYKAAGGKYKSKKPRADNSLVKWTREDWGYVDGDPTGRYLPKEVRSKMTDAEKRRENRLKREGTKHGKKKVKYSKSVLKKYQKVSKSSGKKKPKRKTGGAPKSKNTTKKVRGPPKKRRMQGTKPVKKAGKWRFKDFPDFRPTHSPSEMFQAGAFGGTYWRPIKSKVTGLGYQNQHREFPESWWKGLDEETMLTAVKCNPSVNKYKKTSGTSLDYWESKGWIEKQDPYGWVQWYCRFFMGRRSSDDERQIDRWMKFAGPMGRFRRRLMGMIKKKKTTYNDYSISPTIRQGLLQWGYELTQGDYNKFLE